MPRRGKRGLQGYHGRAAIKARRERDAVAGQVPERAVQVKRKPGRPPGGGVPWNKIKDLVETTGCTLDEVLALPNIPASCTEDPATLTRLNELVERAQRVYRVTLRKAITEKGIKGSVTALLGIARNTAGLEWDKPIVPTHGAPDVAGLEIKLEELLERLAKKRASEGSRAEQAATQPADVQQKRA